MFWNLQPDKRTIKKAVITKDQEDTSTDDTDATILHSSTIADDDSVTGSENETKTGKFHIIVFRFLHSQHILWVTIEINLGN